MTVALGILEYVYLGCRIPVLLAMKTFSEINKLICFTAFLYKLNVADCLRWGGSICGCISWQRWAELRGKLCGQRERWRWAFCISGSQLTIPIKRLELMGDMWVWPCHFHYYRYLTVWMNQWQQSNHNKPVCSWLWRLECLRQEQTPDTKGRLKNEAMPVYWWNICWMMAEQLILYCNRFFFFFGHQENVGMCYLLCREKTLSSLYFIGSFASSGRCLASHLLLHPILQALRERSHESLALTSPPSLCQVLSNRGTRFYATKQKSCHCLLAKRNFPAPQETNHLLDCESFSSKVYSH